MINKSSFKAINEHLKKVDEQREESIRLARDIIKESKIIIYAIQRDEKPSLKEIKKMVKQIKNDGHTNIEATAVQEYVEAACFYSYIYENKLPTPEELDVEIESYLLGLCDLTGELMRRGVKDVIEGKYDRALKTTRFVEEIYGEFLQFDLRNGELRKKSDAIKWNLQKLEQLCLDIAKNKNV